MSQNITSQDQQDTKSNDQTRNDAKHQPYANRRQCCVERKRIKIRRQLLASELTQHAEALKNFGLALSGGGIRSATFALGVMQAMARAAAPPAQAQPHSQAGHQPQAPTAKPPVHQPRLLQRFDYLSTVSGGGYIGAFFVALFLPHRKPLDHQAQLQEAKRAYDAFEIEPPSKIHVTENYEPDDRRGAAAMAWLRENGRYLLAAGAGDTFYALALSLRNLISVHFVLGMPILASLALLGLFKALLKPALCQAFPGSADLVLCQTLWWLPIIWALLAVLPSIIGYWMVYSLKSEDDKVPLFNECSKAMLVILLVFALVGYALVPQLPLGYLCLLGAWELLLALALFYEIHSDMGTFSTHASLGTGVRRYRVEATRRMSQDLIVLCALAFLAAVEHLTGAIYHWLANPQWKAATAVLGPLLIALVRWGVKLLDEKNKPAWFAKLPIDAAAGAIGFVILLFVAVLWGLLVELMTTHLTTDAQLIGSLAGLALLAIGLIFSTGFFIGFINLSSLHSFYSSRLARTFLGASNQQRFKYGSTEQQRRALLSVTEAIPGDDMRLGQYYSSACAPIHLINVTMNLTTDPAEKLVQRDRKGKPLCVAPGSAPDPRQAGFADKPFSVSFILDGHVYRQDPKVAIASEIDQPLNVSHWIATSGAALTTGLGRSTSLGTSLALGLANVRLGTWWPSHFLGNENFVTGTGFKGAMKALSANLFKTQRYLIYELTAHFHGLRREYQYLSDGGHFENTAAYELLRRERNIELVVICDSGSDPDYQFQDLTNLIRLARIDLELEIKVDTHVLGVAALAPYFGRLEDFDPGKPSGRQRCAVLLDVFDISREAQRTNPGDSRKPCCRILLIKPRVIKGLAADAWNYANAHPQFPNESTADQFFDEAQFESYRQLGLAQGRLLFGEDGKHTAVSQALWGYLKLV